jgi:hypothetical protein
MLALLACSAATAALSPAAKLCISAVDTRLRDHGVGCYFGSDDSRRAVLESFFESILQNCDLDTCRCSRNETAGATCDGFATASLTGYINVHSDSVPINDLYEDMKAILQNECMEQTGDAGVPSQLLFSPSYGMCEAANAISAHTGGIGAYIAVYAALFTLVMIETTERSRYAAVPTEEPQAQEKPADAGAEEKTKLFL